MAVVYNKGGAKKFLGGGGKKNSKWVKKFSWRGENV